MRILDAVVDALNSVFPGLSRTSPVPGAGEPRAGEAPGGEEASFAFSSALLQVLGGLGRSRDADLSPAGVPEEDVGQGNPSRTEEGSARGGEEVGSGSPQASGYQREIHLRGSALRENLEQAVARGEDASMGLGNPASLSTEAGGDRSEALQDGAGACQGGSGPMPETAHRPAPGSAVDREPVSPATTRGGPRTDGGSDASGPASARTSGAPSETSPTPLPPFPAEDPTRSKEAGPEGVGALDGASEGAFEGAFEGAPVESPPADGVTSSGQPPSVSKVHAAGPLQADRDLEKLEPGFRTRLDRVMRRMEEEYGHKVEVVEGYRSPRRQESLYAQGRTRPGAVVTWTRDSLHSQGRAADLQVDGRWENPQGYARLQQVAREEGLNTLGSRDPGHLELPDGGASRCGAGDTGAGAGPTFRPMGPSARVARTARVAQAAQVASVARTARPGGRDPLEVPGVQASAGEAAGVAGGPASAMPRGTAEKLREIPTIPESPAPEAPATGATSAGTRDGGERSASPGTESAPPLRGPLQAPTGASSPPAAPPMRTEGLQAPSAAERVAEIQALEEALNARLPGRVSLELENADGAGTNLRLALRGAQLAGRMEMADAAMTERVRARIGELHEVLARQGLDARSLGVQGLRGVDPSGGPGPDMLSLMQDPLAGLARVLEAREGGGTQQRDPRHHPQGGSADGGSRRFDDSRREDRNQEERR